MKRRTKIIVGVAIVIIVGISIAFTSGSDEVGPRTATVHPTTVVQDVSFTAQLESLKRADLGFATSGPITEIAVARGDVVEAGAELVKLDSRIASLDAAKTRADRASGQAQALISWEKAKLDQDNTAAENEQKIEEQKQVVRDRKAELDQALSAWRTRADDEGDDSYLAKTAYSAYLAALTAYNASQEDLTTLRATVATADDAAEKAAELVKEQYLSTTQASAAVAGLSSLEALESRAAVVLSQQTILAPFAGMVTAIDITEGEFSTAGASIIRLETVDQLKIVTEVTESDAVKLALNMPATVTLDALPPTQSWEAAVSYIAPSADIVEGVPVYEIELTFNMADKTLRPGLTANVVVHTDSRQGVFAIPRRAVSTQGSQQFVTVIEKDGSETEREVATGLIGSDGAIEITSGLQQGEVVLISRQDQTP